MPERRDLPLIAWGEALRAARLVRERRQLRLAFGALGIAALALAFQTRRGVGGTALVSPSAAMPSAIIFPPMCRW